LDQLYKMNSINDVLLGIKNSRIVPNISLEVIDVRDLATLHILALEKEEAINQRYVAKNGDLTFKEISIIYGNKPIVIPDFMLRVVAKFQPPLEH